MKKITAARYRPPLDAPESPPVITQDQLMAIYKPPFRLCFMKEYVLDGSGETVADFRSDSNGFRVRGYGMMKTRLKHADAVFDAMEAFLLDLTKDCQTDKGQCVIELNKAWGHK